MEKRLHLLTGFSLVVCLVSVLFEIFAVISTYVQSQKYNTIINEYLYTENELGQLGEGIYHMQTLALLGVMTDDADERDGCFDQLKVLDGQNMDILNELSETITGDAESRLVHSLYSDYLIYSDRQNLIANISSNDSSSTAEYFLNTSMKDSMDSMNDSLTALEDMLDASVDKYEASVYQMDLIRNIATAVMALLTILAVISLALIICRSTQNITSEFHDAARRHREEISDMQQHTIEGLAELVESRDNSTGTHIKNTAHYVEMVAQKLSENERYSNVLTPDYISRIVQYAPLHDVGKILIPDSILLKPGKFTPEEFDIMKQHAAKGGIIVERLLSKVETPENVTLAQDIAMYHHEKWDGSGYPFGISGEDIPLAARIMAIADVFDALISPRCYKPAFTLNEALKIISDGSGNHFEPDIVDAFLALRPRIESYLEESASASDETAEKTGA